MSDIAKAFANGKAFIPFITCGDPDLATTAAAVRDHGGKRCRSHRAWVSRSPDPTAEAPSFRGPTSAH